MLNEENVSTEVLEEAAEEAFEEIAEEEETAPVEICPEDPVMEQNEEVIAIRRHNEAVAYLRNQDCAMLTTLKKHLGENIRLNNILGGINREISRLKNLLKTPKKKLKIWLLIIGIIVAIIGFTNEDAVLLGIIGIGVIAIPIVLKVLADKKWKAFIADINAKIAVQEEKARKAKQDIDEYWQNHARPYILTIIPDRFPTDRVVEYDTVCGVLHLMENLYADTVKEAVNLYDERRFQKMMNSSLQTTARSAVRTAEAAERSAIANESTATSAAAMAASAAVTAASSASVAHSASRIANASERSSDAMRDIANKF